MTSYQVKYEGDFSELEARSLLSSLISIIDTVQEIGKIHNEQFHHDYKLDIKITPFEKGSFIVTFNLHAKQLIDSIFHLISNKDAILYIAALITSLTGIIQFVKWLKGEKPSQITINGNIVIITKDDGNSKEIPTVDYKAIQSSKIHEFINCSFSMIKDNEKIDTVRILEQDGPSLKEMLNVDRDDFDYLTNTTQLLDINTNKHIETITNACVTIVKLSFEKNYKWSFYYEGFKINASIVDCAFFSEIDKRMRFAKGDRLIVNMRIVQEYIKEARSFVNKEYIIDEVIDHIPYKDDQSEIVY